MLERLCQSATGRLLRRAAGFPITETAVDFTRIEGILVCTHKYETTLRFFVRNRRDLVQAHHFKGEFYESEELEIIRRNFKEKGVFVDIGANVGNHTIFAAKILNATKVIPFELNSKALEILTANIALNNCDNVDISFLGFGVSSIAERLFPQRASQGNNLAGARFALQGIGAGLPTICPDVALENVCIDFIKIDVEGMEMDALKSLEKTIQRCRPTIFVEIDNFNADSFIIWCDHHSYVVAEKFQRYEQNVNYLVVFSSR